MALLTTIARRPCRRGRRRDLITWLVGLALLWSVHPRLSAQTSISNEYQIKAVFLFNFAQFVEWPKGAFSAKESSLVIGILGEDPFGAYLDQLVSGEKVGDRSLTVRRYKREDDTAGCHILFVSRSEVTVLGKVIGGLKGKNVLTVSDVDTFTRQGGMVRFAMENGKVRLRINVESAKACGLTISSKLLRPGTLVTPGKD